MVTKLRALKYRLHRPAPIHFLMRTTLSSPMNLLFHQNRQTPFEMRTVYLIRSSRSRNNPKKTRAVLRLLSMSANCMAGLRKLRIKNRLSSPTAKMKALNRHHSQKCMRTNLKSKLASRHLVSQQTTKNRTRATPLANQPMMRLARANSQQNMSKTLLQRVTKTIPQRRSTGTSHQERTSRKSPLRKKLSNNRK